MAENPKEWPRCHTCLYSWCPKQWEECKRCDAVIKILLSSEYGKINQRGQNDTSERATVTPK